MDYEQLKEAAAQRFKAYTANYDLSQTKIALKAGHTYQVASLCQQIAREEGLSEEDILIAYYCGLLHDIGRFEQVTRFNTFYDAVSVDHAHLSCEILYGTEAIPADERCFPGETLTGIIREFAPDPAYDDYIRTAIWWHSSFRYPADFDERTRTFVDILRDADKLDIFRVNLRTPLSEIHNIPMEEFYTSEITPEVLEDFYRHSCILRSKKRTAIDNVVSYMSLYWELVYPTSRNIAKEAGYLNELANFKSKNPATMAELARMRVELGLE